MGTKVNVRLDFARNAKAATTQVCVSAGTGAAVATLGGSASGSSFTGRYGAGVTHSFWLRSVASDGNVSTLPPCFAALGNPPRR